MKRTVSIEEAEIQNLTRQRDALQRELDRTREVLRIVSRRADERLVDIVSAAEEKHELTRIRDELAERVAKLSTRAHYADMYASVVEEENVALEVKVRALEEAIDALLAQMPTFADRVNRWVRGETKCL